MKNVLIFLLLLSVFSVGTLSFSDSVTAASWKKYDSGKFIDYYPMASYKNVSSYQSYVKGSNDLYANIYCYTKSGDKKLGAKVIMSKKNGVIKSKFYDYTYKITKTEQFKTNYGVKTVYKGSMKYMIKNSGITPEKAAFDKRTFNIIGVNVKSYAIKSDNNYIQIFFYWNGEEIMSEIIEKNKNILTLNNYDQKRKLTQSQTFRTSMSVNSAYKYFMNGFSEELNT